jgi:hypothetical protein
LATVVKSRGAKIKVASPKEVRSAVDHLTEEFLRCRDIGHVWVQYKVKRVRGGFERSLYCRSCKASKHQFVSGRGEILASSYVYSDGYQFRGIGRVQSEGKAILRLESLDRTIRLTGGDLEIDPLTIEEEI